MHNMKQAFRIAKQNFSGWKKSPRIWLAFVLALILCLMLSDQVLTQAIRYETILQIFEPFIWTYGDVTSLMLSSLLLILIFADMPFINQSTPYWLIRTKRSVWLAGQILYVVLTTVIYNVFLLIVLGMMAVPYSYIGNVWSETAAMLGYGGGDQIMVPVSIKTMQISTPYKCAAIVFGLMLLYSLFVVTLVLFLNLTVGKMAGVLGAFAINLYGILLNPEIFQKLFHFTGNLEYKANVLCGWISPLNHATFSMHNFGYDYLPKLWVSVCSFLIFIVIFISLAGKRMQKYNFSFVQLDE